MMNEILQWTAIIAIGSGVLFRMEILFFLDKRLINKSKEVDHEK